MKPSHSPITSRRTVAFGSPTCESKNIQQSQSPITSRRTIATGTPTCESRQQSQSPITTRRTVATGTPISESIRPVPRPRTPKSLVGPRMDFAKSPSPTNESSFRPIPRPRESLRHKSFYDNMEDNARFESYGEETLPPPRAPPIDKVITTYNAVQLAGMMRHLGFGRRAVNHCVTNNINGYQLLQIFRDIKTNDGIQHELKLDKLGDVHCLQLFVNQSELAKDLPSISPPEDGNIRDFSVRELAGLLKNLEFTEKTVSRCLVQQIDGDKLCGMDHSSIREELVLSRKDFYALEHFISSSELYKGAQ